jgi:hypothetical protein
VSKEDVACYRLYAANCVELAEGVSDTDRRLFLLRMAQAWARLADQVEKNELNNSTEASFERPKTQNSNTQSPNAQSPNPQTGAAQG